MCKRIPHIQPIHGSREECLVELVARGDGEAQTLSEVQANLAKEGLSLLTYLEMVNFNLPHTQIGFINQVMGWLWTEANTFPLSIELPMERNKQVVGCILVNWMNSQVHLSTTTPPRLGSRLRVLTKS